MDTGLHDFDRLSRRLDTKHRRRLSARGIARSMIWRDGVLPKGSPPFAKGLSEDLLDYAYSLLSTAFSLRRAGAQRDEIRVAFLTAAESIESVLRNGERNRRDRGYLSVVCAAAFHLAGYSARSYIVVKREDENLSPAERIFVSLLLRKFSDVRRRARGLMAAILREDESGALATAEFSHAIARGLALNYCKAVAGLLAFFLSGDHSLLDGIFDRLDIGVEAAAEQGLVEVWWLNKVTRLVVEDIARDSYHSRLPIPEEAALRELRGRFIRSLASRPNAQVDLWPSQLDAAVRALDASDNLVVALPTSAGKTRIAELAMLPALASGRDVIFVSPLRALSAQVEHTLRDAFGTLGYPVSSSYESLGTHFSDEARASITVLTPEKLDFALRRNPDFIKGVGLVIFDEGHLIGAEPREIKYELLVDRLLRAGSGEIRFVCLSALFPGGDQFDDFVSWFGGATPVVSNWRPTRRTYGHLSWMGDHARLDLQVDDTEAFVEHFLDQSAPDPATKRKKAAPSDEWELLLLSADKLASQGESVLIYCPTKASVNAGAKVAVKLVDQGLMRGGARDVLSSDDIRTLNEWLGENHPVAHCISRGVAVHHADLPVKILSLVERLIRDRLAPIVIASPTVSQGLNISASTVIFQSIHRHRPGSKGVPPRLPVEEFHNVVGRAGRAFVDTDGRILYSLGMKPKTVDWKLSEWNRMVAGAAHRDLMSGLYQLVMQLLQQLLAKGYSISQDWS